jgi:ribonuclease-3
MVMKHYSELLEKLNIKFSDPSVLIEALTHSSYGNEHNCAFNERLEFLGDAVLELAMSKYLISKYNMNEGDMTKHRAQAVREEALVIYASHINLSDYLYLGNGEEQTGGRNRPAIIADAFEALLGAIFQTYGFDKAYEIFEKIVVPYVQEVVSIKDYKTTLQELVQADKRTLKYSIINQSGPAHNMRFEAIVLMDDEIVMGYGIGRTKKDAEQNAAKEALTKIAKGD